MFDPLTTNPDGSRMSASQRQIARLEDELRHMRRFRQEFMLYMRIWLRREQTLSPNRPIAISMEEAQAARNDKRPLEFSVDKDNNLMLVNFLPEDKKPDRPLIIVP